MAKRFIDTGFLDQKWIRKLAPERKIFIIYLMLKCDNGGVIDLDMDDAEFWVGKKLGDPAGFLPAGFLIHIKDEKYFIPKFLKWQYPNFPHSKVHQQKQAIRILTELDIFDIETNSLRKNYLTFTQPLPDSQVIVNDNGNGNANKGGSGGKELTYKKFYREQWDLSKGHQYAAKYQYLIKYLMNIEQNLINEPGEHILKLKKQMTFEEFVKLYNYCKGRQTTIKDLLDSWLNKPSYSTGKISVYAVLRNWASKAPAMINKVRESNESLIDVIKTRKP